MTDRGWRAGLAAVALAGGLALAGCGEAPPRGGAPAPDFEHPDLEGTPIRLSNLRGRTVVIDFWATWCAPCVFQPAELNQVWAAHREAGDVVVLGVEVGGATPQEVRAWGEENEAVADYPLLVGAPEDLARRFGALGFPATVIVDPQGAIASVTVGLATAAEVEASLAELAARRAGS